MARILIDHWVIDCAARVREIIAEIEVGRGSEDYDTMRVHRDLGTLIAASGLLAIEAEALVEEIRKPMDEETKT